MLLFVYHPRSPPDLCLLKKSLRKFVKSLNQCNLKEFMHQNAQIQIESTFRFYYLSYKFKQLVKGRLIKQTRINSILFVFYNNLLHIFILPNFTIFLIGHFGLRRLLKCHRIFLPSKSMFQDGTHIRKYHQETNYNTYKGKK